MDTELKINFRACGFVGPAGKLVRVARWYALAKARNLRIIFDPFTAEWWEAAFRSRFYQVAPVEGVPEPPETALEELFPDKQIRDEYIWEAAKEILIFEQPLQDKIQQILLSFPKNYYCIYRRGTDKVTEACFFPLPLFVEIISEWQRRRPLSLVGVSDSQYCIDELKKQYPELQTTPTHKSQNERPLHLHSPIPAADLLKGVIIDSYVMGMSQGLIYSYSMMVELARMFNPTLPIYNVEVRVDLRMLRVLKSMSQYIVYRDRYNDKR